METADTIIRATRVVTPAGEQPAAVGIRDGRITFVDDINTTRAGRQELRLPATQALLPGLVDTHVHLQDPGNTTWENFESGTRAAARGGITTLIDMPLDSLPITVSVDALNQKLQAASHRLYVNVGFWGGVTPWNLTELKEMREAGVFGFKCFLANTGLPEFPPIDLQTLEQALRVLRELGSPLLVHAEHGAALDAAPHTAGRDYRRFLQARPASIEATAVTTVIEAVRATGGRAHVVHVSTAEAAALIADAQAEGLQVTAETCPHYLALVDTDVRDGDTSFKVCPPIRDAANQEQLWQHLAAGDIGMVVSDHSPTAIEEKCLDIGDFDSAFGGLSSLQISLPVMWTHARRRGYTLADIAQWMATRPARFAGLDRKGVIAPGYDADLCVFAPDESCVVTTENLEHRQPVTPYAGRTLDGVVVQSWLGGQPITFDQPRGRSLHQSSEKESLLCASS
jgi:allantoinase